MQSDQLCHGSCPSRFYGSSATTLCTACPFDCLTCDSSGLLCLSCDSATDFRALDTLNSRCFPMAGHFENNTVVTPQCSAGCSLCNNLTLCSSCFSGSFLRADGLCYSSCLQRTFPNPVSLTCQVCPFDCLTCNSSGACLSCDSSVDHRVLDTTSGRCVPQVGFFQSNTAIAAQCPLLCASCFSLASCGSCQGGYFLRNDSLCYTGCPLRFFGDNATQRCTSCPYDCLSCSSAGNCLSCDSTVDHRVLDSASGRCVPAMGYFEVAASPTTVAAQCAFQCTSCGSLTNCTSCRAGFYLLPSGACESSCPARFYFNSQASTCDPCSSNCTLCLTALSCTSCALAYYRTPSNACVTGADCPLGRFPDRNTLVCETCLYDCQTCINNVSCSSCNASNLRAFDSASFRCWPIPGYYDSGLAQALQCPLLCTTCLSLTRCTACQPLHYVARNGSCLPNCTLQPAAVGKPRSTCAACPYDCLTCNLYGDCLTCNISEFRILDPARSRCAPMPGYYDSGAFVSQPCSQGCASCSSATTCQQCGPDYSLNGNGQCEAALSSSSFPVAMVVGIAAGALIVAVIVALVIYLRCRESSEEIDGHEPVNAKSTEDLEGNKEEIMPQTALSLPSANMLID
jgi:proprotein convertase subtilisin/kexin type 5